MAPYRGPVFSQGRAWLPPWLAASSLQSGAAVCETPSMFATSWKDLDETILNGDLRSTPSSVFKDITNKSFPCLHLSDDMSIDALSFQGIEDFKLENKSGSCALQFSQPKAFVLQLSLSQTQATADTSPKCGLICKPESEGERNSKPDGNTIVVHSQQEGSELVRNWGSPEKALVTEKHCVSPAAAQSTGSAELLNPQSSQVGGKHTTSFDQSAQLHMKRPAEKLPSNVREGKKLKSKNTKAVNEDVQAAIGLTVATAETLVIADILNGCQMCQSAGAKAILDAALMLRKEREAFGLDCFTLEDLPCKASPDQEWDEELDDATLEAEFLGTLPIDSMKGAPRGHPCVLADTQVTECFIEAKNALTTVGVDNHTEAATSQHHQTQCEESYGGAVGVVQRLIHMQSVLEEKGDEGITSRDCTRAQLMAPKDSFNSRWLGGWTGANCDKEKQGGHNLQQAGKKLIEFETSELSESCDLPPPVENLLRCSENHQNKGSDCAVTSMPEVHAEALTAGSYAEILLALSQASVKCSLQEPLCSFVPCSVNAKPRSSENEPAKWNSPESTNEMAVKHADSMVNGHADSMVHGLTAGRPCDNQNMAAEEHPPVTSPTRGVKHADSMVNGHADSMVHGLTSRPCDNQNMAAEEHPPVTSPTRGVKRIHLNSLQRYSTNPLSPLVEAMMQNTTKQLSKKINDTKETSYVNCDQTDIILKADESTLPSHKSALSGQCELILQDSGLQDSPPLIWHRGKRRRLRACRVAESDLTQCNGDDSTCGFLPNEDCAGFKTAPLAPKDDVPLQSLDNHITTEQHVVNTKPGVQEECTLKMRENGHSDTRVLDKINTKHKADNRRGRGSMNSQLFKGIDFLVTGFPASQKNVSEEVSKKIEEHGGVTLSSIPSLDRSKILATTARHSIIVAPQKVRTLKYLYGCAAGLLIVRPNWLDECITMKRLLFKHKYKGKGSVKQHHTSLCPDEAGRKDLIFSKIAAFLHGQRSYCSKLSLLIQHGGGKVVRSAKSLVQANDAKGSLIQIVVAEHHSKLPQTVKDTAASSGFSIVSGDWIIDSLLNGKLVSLPAANAFRDMKGSTVSKVATTKIAKGLLTKKRQSMREASSFETAVIDNTILPCKEANMDEPCVSFLGKGAAMPTLSRMGLSFVLELPKSFTLRELRSCCTYYKAACINGVIYSAGDIVEVRPETREEKEPYVAQIESFYAAHSGNVNTRSAGTGPKRQPRKVCFLCCRWFYRPSDTGFPCVGTGKELYLSQHFDDNAPINTIIRRVQVVLFVDGKVMTNDAEKGWETTTETSHSVDAADYVCRFFYDYRKESLHQLKSALTY